MVSVSPDPVPALHFHLKDHDHSPSAHVLWSTSIPLGPHSYPLKTPSASWFSLLFALAVLSAPATTIWWHPSRVQAYCPFPFCCQEWPTLTSNSSRCPGPGSFPSSSDCSHFWECLGEDQVSWWDAQKPPIESLFVDSSLVLPLVLMVFGSSLRQESVLLQMRYNSETEHIDGRLKINSFLFQVGCIEIDEITSR